MVLNLTSAMASCSRCEALRGGGWGSEGDLPDRDYDLYNARDEMEYKAMKKLGGGGFRERSMERQRSESRARSIERSQSRRGGRREEADMREYVMPDWGERPMSSSLFNLEVLKNDSVVNNFQLKSKAFYTVGRQKETSDILLEHPSVSRVHAILQFNKLGLCFLYDMGSSHGTYVNGELLQKKYYLLLRNNDELKFGRSARVFRVRISYTGSKNNSDSRRVAFMGEDSSEESARLSDPASIQRSQKKKIRKAIGKVLIMQSEESLSSRHNETVNELRRRLKIIEYTERDLEKAREGKVGKLDDFSHSKQATKLLTLENKIQRLEDRLEQFVTSSIIPIVEEKEGGKKVKGNTFSFVPDPELFEEAEDAIRCDSSDSAYFLDDGNRGNVLRSRIARLQTCLWSVRKQIRKLQDDIKLVAKRLSSVKKKGKEHDSEADDWRNFKEFQPGTTTPMEEPEEYKNDDERLQDVLEDYFQKMHKLQERIEARIADYDEQIFYLAESPEATDEGSQLLSSIEGRKIPQWVLGDHRIEEFSRLPPLTEEELKECRKLFPEKLVRLCDPNGTVIAEEEPFPGGILDDTPLEHFPYNHPFMFNRNPSEGIWFRVPNGRGWVRPKPVNESQEEEEVELDPDWKEYFAKHQYRTHHKRKAEKNVGSRYSNGEEDQDEEDENWNWSQLEPGNGNGEEPTNRISVEDSLRLAKKLGY